MADKSKSVAVAFTIDKADQAKQDVDKIRAAFEQLGNSGKKSAQPIIDSLNNIESSQEKVTNKIHDGRLVTEKDGKVILQQFEVLKAQIDATFGSIANAPLEIQHAFKIAETQAHGTSKAIAELSDSVADQKEKLKEGGVAWSGLGDQLNKVLGKFGGIQVGALAAWAALKEGIAVGTQVAESIGTNFSAAESATHNLKESLKGITNALTTDGLGAALEQTAASLLTLNDTINGGGDQLAGFNAIVQTGVSRADAYALSTDQLAKAADAYKIAQSGGAESLKFFGDSIKAAAPNSATFGASIDDITAKLKIFADQGKIANEVEEARQKAILGTVAAIQSEIGKLQAEKEARALSLEALTNEILERQNYKEALKKDLQVSELSANVHGLLTESMQKELEHLLALVPNYEKNTVKIAAYSDALKADLELHKDGIQPAYAEQLTQLIALIESFGKTADATKGNIQWKIADALNTGKAAAAAADHTAATVKLTKATDGHSASLTNVTGASDKLLESFEKTGEGVKNLGLETEHAGDKFDASKVHLEGFHTHITLIGTASDAAKTHINQLTSELDALNKKLLELVKNASAAAQHLHLLDGASKSAAGDGGAINYNNTFEDAPPSVPPPVEPPAPQGA